MLAHVRVGMRMAFLCSFGSAAQLAFLLLMLQSQKRKVSAMRRFNQPHGMVDGRPWKGQRHPISFREGFRTVGLGGLGPVAVILVQPNNRDRLLTLPSTSAGI